MSDDPPGYISINEAADILNITTQVAYTLVYRNVLPSKRRGSRVWVSAEAVEQRRDALTKRSQCIGIDEVAVFFGVHVETVRTWHLTKLLHAETIARRLCFDLSEIVAFVPPGGRPSAHTPTRTIRGTYYPPPSTREGTP